MPVRCGSPKNFGLPAARIFAVGLLIIAFSQSAQLQTVEGARPQSSLRVALSAVGYEGLSESARLSGESNLTLDFVDASHLLFTFNPKKLFKRLPDCPPSHDDRLIHAAIIELPSGRIVREADWYLHDSRPYLWRLGSGQFLLRRLNRLYRVDDQLSEKQVFDSTKELRWVSVTPDGKQVITETLEKSALSGTDGGKKPHAQISFLDANSFTVLQLDFFVASLKQEQAEARLLDADRRMFATVDAFAHLARYLSGIPGRKNLVWLSGSFQLGIYPDSKGDSPFLEAHSYSEQLKKVANLLQEAHVAVYPVDVRGLQTNPLFTATTNDTLSPLSMQSSTPIGVAQEGSAPFAGPRPLNNAVAISVMQDQNEQFALAQTGERATMDQIAADTGGRAFYNANDISKAIYTAAEQGSNYYALSYTPSNKNYDGRFRRIKVSLPGKRLHLAYRSGYYALNPSLPAKGSRDLRSSLAVAAMQQGSPQSRQILFSGTVVPIGKAFLPSKAADLNAGKAKRKKEPPPQAMQHYSIDYTIAADDLHFGSTPNGTFLNTLNFMITVFDEDGRLVAAQNSQAAVNLKPEALRSLLKDGLRARQQIDVPTKSASMRLGVEEISDSHIGTLEIPLPVKSPPQSASDSRRRLPPIEPD